MKTLLITGINGFLGSNLAKLLSDEYQIIGLEYSLKDLFRIKEMNLKVYVSGDNLKTIFEEHEIYAILHAATVYRRTNDPIDSVISTNILLPVKLIELANTYKVPLFLNTDSFFNDPRYKYFYLPDYTLSKRQVLEWLKLLNRSCRIINMKIHHMFGPDDAPGKFIPSMIESLKRNIPLLQLTAGEQVRDFVYIMDVVEAYRVVLGENNEKNPSFITHEVGTGTGSSIKELIMLMKEQIGSTTQLDFGSLAYRENEIMYAIAENSSLLKLGWKVKFPIAEGLRHTITR